MLYLLLQSLTAFLVLALSNAHIRSHPLHEQQEQITLLEGGKLWFSPLNGERLEPIVLPWKCHIGHIMEHFNECNNCTKFQFYTGKVGEDIHFFLWFYVNVKSWLAPLIQFCRPEKETGDRCLTIESREWIFPLATLMIQRNSNNFSPTSNQDQMMCSWYHILSRVSDYYYLV